MSKTIVFVDDCTSLCSRPQFAERESPAALLLLTDASELLVRDGRSAPVRVDLAAALPLSAGERAVAVKRFSPDRLFVATNLFNFHTVGIQAPDAPVLAATHSFKYGKHLKPLNGAHFLKWGDSLIFASGKFVFAFSAASGEFKILKLLSGDVTRYLITGDDLVVLTRKELLVFRLGVAEGAVVVSQTGRVAPEEETYLAMDLWGDGVALLSTKSDVVLRSLGAGLAVTSRFKLSSAFNGDVDVTYLAAFEGHTLAVGSRSTLYVLSRDLTRVRAAFSTSRLSCLVTPTQFLNWAVTITTSSAKAPPNLRFGVLTCEVFTRESKRRQFEAHAIPLQLSILKTYLMKKAFQHKSFPNPVELFRQMMGRIVLKKELVKDPGMKGMVVEFFESLKHFTVEKFGKCYLCVPKVVPIGGARKGSATAAKKSSLSEAETAESLSGSPAPAPNQAPSKTLAPVVQPVQQNRQPTAAPLKSVAKRLDFSALSLKKSIKKNRKAILRAAVGKLLRVFREAHLRDDDRLHWTVYLCLKYRLRGLLSQACDAARAASVSLCLRGERKLAAGRN